MNLEKIVTAIETRLVSDWRACWRWLSVQGMAATAAVEAAWAAFPQDLRQVLPDRAVHGLAAALLVLSILARLIRQDGAKSPAGQGGPQ